MCIQKYCQKLKIKKKKKKKSYEKHRWIVILMLSDMVLSAVGFLVILI